MYFKDFFLYISSVLLNWNDLKSLLKVNTSLCPIENMLEISV